MPDTGPRAGGWRPWRQAWADALYGTDGFYRSPAGPARHFGTSANGAGGIAELFAEAALRLARQHGCTTLVDVGAGRGELLRAVHAVIGAQSRVDTSPPLHLLGVDVVGRPADLPDQIDWLVAPGGAALPDGLTDLRDALVLANEWLDVVPLDVLEVDPAGLLREVEVDRSGAERLAAPADPAQLAWSREWWPADAAEPGQRVEVGLTRDAAWTDLVGRVRSGVVVAVDYGHTREQRPPFGSLTGHRAGRAVPPVPDGSCDLTAHVALDSLPATVRRTQRAALRGLGVDAGRPAPDGDPTTYLAGLQRSGAAAELLDPGGFGGFGWVERQVAIGQPDPPPARLDR